MCGSWLVRRLTARCSGRRLRAAAERVIVSRTGEGHMESIKLRGVVVHRSTDELAVTGRLRIGVVAGLATVFGVMIMFSGPAPGHFRVLMAAGMALGISIVVARSRSRLVLGPTGFVVSGYEGLRRYQLAGRLENLEVVGVVPMMPELENMPYKDPDYFLHTVVDGRIVRAFRGLPRAELDEIAAQIRGWKASCAG